MRRGRGLFRSRAHGASFWEGLRRSRPSVSSRNLVYVLAAGQRHGPSHRGLLVAPNNKVMAFGFARDGLIDGSVEQRIVLARPERRAEIGRVLLAETHIKSAGAGDPHPIAGFAEIMGHRSDEAEPPAGLPHLHIAGGSARAIRDLVEGEMPLEPRADEREREILLDPVGADLAHRHGLDQSEIEAAPMRPAQNIFEFRLVHIAQSYGIDLDFETGARSEEHTSELQSQFHLVCRLLLEKKKQKRQQTIE